MASPLVSGHVPVPGSDASLLTPKSRSGMENFFEKLVSVSWINNSLMQIRDLVNPGSGIDKVGSCIKCKHPGSATLVRDRIRFSHK